MNFMTDGQSMKQKDFKNESRNWSLNGPTGFSLNPSFCWENRTNSIFRVDFSVYIGVVPSTYMVHTHKAGELRGFDISSSYLRSQNKLDKQGSLQQNEESCFNVITLLNERRRQRTLLNSSCSIIGKKIGI